jgi:hypothetical protein
MTCIELIISSKLEIKYGYTSTRKDCKEKVNNQNQFAMVLLNFRQNWFYCFPVRIASIYENLFSCKCWKFEIVWASYDRGSRRECSYSFHKIFFPWVYEWVVGWHDFWQKSLYFSQGRCGVSLSGIEGHKCKKNNNFIRNLRINCWICRFEFMYNPSASSFSTSWIHFYV